MECNSGQNHDPDLFPDLDVNTIAGYDLLRMIDYGSFGDILKVKAENNKIFALKQIKYRGNFHDDPYIINEVYCLTHLKHKNVVHMYEVLVSDGEIDIVMEYAENENLERYVADNELEFVMKYKMYGQVLAGVEYCHGMGIAHRDLTPGNILLTKDLVVKIADFGLAVKCSPDDDGGPALCDDYLGRVSYLAPEVLRQKPFQPQPSDVWSLGVTLLFLLFHSIPYTGFEPDILKDQEREIWKDFVTEKTEEHCVKLKRCCVTEKTGDEDHVTLKPCVTEFMTLALDVEPESRATVGDLVLKWDDIGPESCFVQH